MLRIVVVVFALIAASYLLLRLARELDQLDSKSAFVNEAIRKALAAP